MRGTVFGNCLITEFYLGGVPDMQGSGNCCIQGFILKDLLRDMFGGLVVAIFVIWIKKKERKTFRACIGCYIFWGKARIMWETCFLGFIGYAMMTFMF